MNIKMATNSQLSTIEPKKQTKKTSRRRHTRYETESRGLGDVYKRQRLLYPAKLSFRIEGQTKCFPEKVKLKDFIITKPLLHEMLKGLI